jgi:hypothetical protein
VYTIKARDFAVCKNEDCTTACKEGAISCVKTECTEQDIEDEICLTPELEEVENVDLQDNSTSESSLTN